MFTFVPTPNIALQCSWGPLGSVTHGSMTVQLAASHGCGATLWFSLSPNIMLALYYTVHKSVTCHTQLEESKITCFVVEPHCSRATLICHDNTMTIFFCPPIWYNGTQFLHWKNVQRYTLNDLNGLLRPDWKSRNKGEKPRRLILNENHSVPCAYKRFWDDRTPETHNWKKSK